MPDSDYKLKQKKAKLYSNPVSAVVAPLKPIIGQYDEPEPNRVLVPDAHQYSGVIDGARLFASGVRLLLLKYSDGLRMSRFFKENYRQCKDNGVMVGSWHWLRSGERNGGEGCSTGQQARLYNALLRDFPIDMPQPYVDFERLYGKRDDKKNANGSDLWSFREVFRPLFGETIGVYTGHYYWYEKGMPWDDSWEDSSLWGPRYSRFTYEATRPWELKGWDFWQFSENIEGALYGFREEKSIDMSYWRGTLTELLDFCWSRPHA